MDCITVIVHHQGHHCPVLVRPLAAKSLGLKEGQSVSWMVFGQIISAHLTEAKEMVRQREIGAN